MQRYKDIAPKANEAHNAANTSPAGPASVVQGRRAKKRNHHSPEDWAAQRETIIRLYVIQNRGLNETVKLLRESHDFETGARKLKFVLKDWNISKNVKATQWAALSSLVVKRKHDEGKDTDVVLDGSLLSAKKVKRELERYANVITTTTERYEGRLQALTPLLLPRDGHLTKRSPSIDMEHESFAERLITNNAMSPLNLGLQDLSDLDREFWTENLSFHGVLRILYELTKNGFEVDEDSAAELLLSPCLQPKNQTGYIPQGISSSHSISGLKILATDILACRGGYVLLRVWHPLEGVERANISQLLDIALCAIVSVNDPLELLIPTLKPVLYLVMQWLSDPKHALLLRCILTEAATPTASPFFRIFAQKWMELAIHIATGCNEEQNQLRANIAARIEGALASSCLSTVQLIDFNALFATAANLGKLSICRLLLQNGPLLDRTCARPDPMEHAIMHCDVLMVQFLLEEVSFGMTVLPGPKLPPVTGNTVSYLSIALFKWAELNVYSAGGVGNSVNQKRRGSTEDIIGLLLRNGADPSTPCWETLNAWEICALMGAPLPKPLSDPDDRGSCVIRIAAAARLDPSSPSALQDVSEDVTPLEMQRALAGALIWGPEELILSLLDAGTNPDCLDLRKAHSRRTHLATSEVPILTVIWHLSDCTSTRMRIATTLFDRQASLPLHVLEVFELAEPKLKVAFTPRLFRRPDLLSCVPQRAQLLRIAVIWDLPEEVKRLIELGQSANSSFRANTRIHPVGRESIFQLALRSSRITTVQVLWDKGARFASQHHGGLELYCACCAGVDSEAKILFLLDHGARPNTILHTAHFGRQTPLMRAVAKAGGLTYAPSATVLRPVRALLTAGADPDLVVEPHAPTGLPRWPLGIACRQNCLPAVRLLLGHGAAIPPEANVLCVPLREGAWCSRATADIVARLIAECRRQGIEMGADATAALGLAATMGFVNVAMQLLEAGADVNALVRFVRCANKLHVLPCEQAECPVVTAVENAAFGGWADMVQLLINAGARGVEEVGCREIEGRPHFGKAIELAREGRHLHVVGLLQRWRKGENAQRLGQELSPLSCPWE